MGPGVHLEWSIWGDEIISRELLRFEQRAVSDMRPAYLAIVADIMEATEEQFESEGKRASGGWDPLSEPYAAWKGAQDYDPGTILRATNALLDSFTQDGGDGQILVTQGGNLEFGSASDYGEFHQRGVPDNNLPQRRPLDFTELDKRGWMKQLQTYIMTGELGVQAAV